jgi:zinc transporter 1/2/3
MSVHSLFETLALGIAQDRLSATMMAISIGLHQPAESVALLVAFLKTSLPIEAIVKWLGLFSAVGMLGVCLGLLISKVASPFVDAILVAITAGTFLYVGATEICNEEFEEGSLREKLTRFAALIGGISVIAIITGVTEKFEGHHHTTHGHDHVQ